MCTVFLLFVRNTDIVEFLDDANAIADERSKINYLQTYMYKS